MTCLDCGAMRWLAWRITHPREYRRLRLEAGEWARLTTGSEGDLMAEEHWPTLEETEAEDTAAGRIDEAKVAEHRQRMRAELAEYQLPPEIEAAIEEGRPHPERRRPYQRRTPRVGRHP